MTKMRSVSNRSVVGSPLSFSCISGQQEHKLMKPHIAKTRRNTPTMSSTGLLVCHLAVFFLFFGLARGQSGPVSADWVFSVDEGQPPGFLVGTIPPQPGVNYAFSDAPSQFTLDSITGEIRTAVEIDREQLEFDVFDVLVLATSNSRTNPVEVKIIVSDLNDNSPAFENPDISITFSEIARVGSQVIIKSATDPDKAANGNIVEYSVLAESHEIENKFRLVTFLGPDSLPIFIYIETSDFLDYERQNFYNLTISAKDGGSPPRYGYLHVNISILDSNDHPPEFNQTHYLVTINESTPANTVLLEVYATDEDSGINGQVEYFIDEDTTYFDFESATGAVVLQQQLNYINSDPYQVTLKVRDRGTPTLFGRAFLSVYVIDENDHDPHITFGYFPEGGSFATVTEGVAEGSIVALVTVTDDDRGDNGEVNLQIINGNELQHFELEPLTLLLPTFSQANIFKVLVVDEVDRENVAQYNLTLLAWDNGIPRRQIIDNLVIHVVDTNDHPPEFLQTEYYASLSEGEPFGSFVQSVTATDADFGLNAWVSYSILEGNDLQWFHINPETGLVTTGAQLNREVASVVLLNISAIDQGAQPLMTTTTLTITILDENDESPQFSSSEYTAAVPENLNSGFEVTTVSATDGDQGTSGYVRYAFTNDIQPQYSEVFSIDDISGLITTNAMLDHEDVSAYDLTVRAYDGGDTPKESVVSVHINVIDENDNKPIFYPQAYFGTVQENNPDSTFIVQVNATDMDSGNYGTLTYFLIGGNDAAKFRVESSTGNIWTVSPLDREMESQYTLIIDAVDGGGLRADIKAEVRISVSDIQDNPPIFDQANYDFEILESANSGSFVGNVTASSQDLNSQVVYTIFSGDPFGQFEIDGATGALHTTSQLDRETTADYELVIYASGGGMFSRVTVNVIILDVNDNTPQFPRLIDSTDVVENWEVGRQFYQVQATDDDSPPNGIIVYDLITNPGNTFRINHTTGWLFLNMDLQTSSQDEYNLEIVASDLGTPRKSATLELVVMVRDVNNHNPQFISQVFQTAISEMTEVNTRFFSLTATDNDQGSNGMISYDILSGNGDDAFGIFPDGQVYVKNFLDRERISEYTIGVRAQDGGIPFRNAFTELLIEILDENDNRPLFNDTTYSFDLPEGSAVNTIVGVIFATDADVRQNAQLVYSFSLNQTQFSLDQDTGIITNLVRFDREALVAEYGHARYTIDAIVKDSGVIPFQDRTSITITISDINDNTPVFLRPSYQVTISELAENGTHVLRVMATDSDSGDNSYILYFIVEGNEDEAFIIGRTSGQITLVGPLDRETTSTYSLTVKAQDAGMEPRSSTIQVQIEILDENDHVPIFADVETYLEVTECLEIGEPITMVSATDFDIGENGLISYSITDGDIQQAFRIDSDTGDVTLARLLDHETTSSYVLNITARDSGVPPLTTVARVFVNVRDCNDNSPVFPQHSIVQWIDEEIPLNTQVVTVTASDPDSGINGETRYAIMNQEPAGEHFSIDPESGLIVTSAKIDHEYLKVHSGVFKLIIRATDQALPIATRRSSTIEVIIFVQDINDNAPVFQTHNAVVISSGAMIGTPVTTVTAKDADDGDNGAVSYSLINRSVPFVIDTDTGEVRLTRDIVGSELSYTLIVNAEDGGQTPERTTTEIVILVVDDTNNGPMFTMNVYSGTVTENEPVGTDVVTLSAGYSDQVGASIEYYITSVISSGMSREGDFLMRPDTGAISTGVVIDRELLNDDSTYTVMVYAVDLSSLQPRTSSTEVRITVLDVNDSPPIFEQSFYNVSISEDAPSTSPLTTVTARDADLGSNAEVTYSIVSGNDGHFTIDPNTGRIRTTGRLDRETTASYSLGVRATDGRQSTVSTLGVTLLDTNDNDPSFTMSTYSFNVGEDHQMGTVVESVTATDPDAGTNGEVVYSVILDGAPGEDVFSLDPVTGAFTLLSELDYEQKQLYFLTIEASDRGATPRSTTATVYFNILDVNDNTPNFDPNVYWVEVAEDVGIGTEITVVTATDADSGPNGYIAFSISAGDQANSFSVYPNGSIITVATLDRELQSFYNLEITAQDQAAEPTQRRSAVAQVTVIISDVNDNAPMFVTGDYAAIREDIFIGQVVMFVQATDADVEKNSYVEYSLSPVPGDVFLINELDGNIRLFQDLDRETVPEYVLTVHATDKGQPSQSTSVNITIEVTDVNDNSPVFAPSTYHSSLPEDIPVGLEFVRVSATDSDEGVNAELRFAITDGNFDSDFSIDTASGVLSVANSLDRERRASYSLTVRAQDGGDGSKMSTAVVTVTVQDINDNAPTFVVQYAPSIVENNQVDALVFSVSAVDGDDGANGLLSYRIDGNNYGGLFTIIPDTGAVYVGALLDREEVETYTLKIVAEDEGTPPLEGATDVVITVVDDNDNQPRFELASYSATLLEEISANIPVIRVTANDADSTADLRYRLDPSIGHAFTITPFLGQILTAGRLDREDRDVYDIVVTVEDGDMWTSQVTVTVTLQDINDNSPRYTAASYQALIPATTPSGTYVIAVEAVDNDIGVNAKLTYSLTSGDTAKFTINAETGFITTSQPFTGETGPYTLGVTAADADSSHPVATATVQVTVDASTQFPSFQSPSDGASFTVDEDAAAGVPVVTLQATSPKGGPEASLSYAIVGGNVDDVFTVDAQTGSLTVNDALDYEVYQAYSLLVEVRDSAAVPLSALISIVISVNDINDNYPVFEFAGYVGTITENQPGTDVLQVQATDSDGGLFGNVVYSLLVGGNIGNSFSIHQSSGWLRTTKSLDRESLDSYTLTVQAADQGSPARTTLVEVRVTVQDINDNQMTFTNLFSATVAENTPMGADVVTVATSDPDILSDVLYTIDETVPGDFIIDPVTGQIRVNATLDREVQSLYQITVTASDESFNVATTVSITVTDKNDNAPTFDQPAYAASLPEGLPAGSPVIQVGAQDDDAGTNRDIFYTLKTMSDYFTINEDTGYITIKNSVAYVPFQDSTNPNEYLLSVLARDRGVPSMYTDVPLTVTIYDANEFAPVFEQSEYFSPVPFDAAVDDNILQVVATDDLDQGDNAQIEYRVIGGNGSSRFDVEQDSGWIQVQASLLAAIGSYYDIVVEAKDRGQPSPRSVQVNVQFLVTDSNDDAPSFDQPAYQVSVSESLSIGSEVTTVSAADADSGVNGMLLYSIVSGNEAGLFAVAEQTGSITVADYLDYEVLTSHTIQIKVVDQGWQSKEGSTVVTIDVTDVDDNSPVFEPDQYDPKVAENSPSATYVTTVTATDADTGPNAAFTYDLIGGDGKDLFTIDGITGEIRTQGNLDYEGPIKIFQLSVEAANQDGSRFGVAHVTVELTGVNEDYPQFVQQSYQYAVSEAAAEGSVVGMVYARDDDDGVDGQVTYMLIGSSNQQGFAIDGLTGEIVVANANGELDRETKDTIVLSVIAKNDGPITGDNVDDVEVTITLLDANDPPQFLDDFYEASVSEGDSPGTFVTTVTAVEYDQSNDFRQFSYAILDGNVDGAFNIDPLTGSITVAAGLDRETVAVYTLRVGAIDTGTPPQTGYTDVAVNLEDVNDNGPTFLPGNDVGYILENEGSGAFVMTLNATDPDLNTDPDLFTFYLQPTADSPSFTLESSTGVLRTTRTLDREQQSEYYLTVESRDGAIPEVTALSTIRIIVEDQNDNPSSARDARILIKAYQSVFPGGLIGIVRPNDLDTGDVFLCQIVSGNTNIFSIQPGCGLNSLMHSTESTYLLEITGDDGQHSSILSNFEVSYGAFDNASLSDSIVLRLADADPEMFLSDYYDSFSASVSTFLSSRESLLILSLNAVENDATKTDLMLAIARDDGYLLSDDTAKLISDNKATIMSQSGVTIETVDYSPCLSSPCQNSGTCTVSLQLRPTQTITDSLPIIFVAPEMEHTFTCSCPGDFFGSLCEDQMDLCTPDPCMNGATCNNDDSGASCSCIPGFEGDACETNTDDCVGRPCLNGGSCEDLLDDYTCHCETGFGGIHCEDGPCAQQPCLNGGTCVEEGSSFRCECLFEDWGDNCQLTSLGFQQGSYMEYPSLANAQNAIILQFSTVSQNALLVYNHDGGTTSSAEFLALEVLEGKLTLSYNLGDGITVISTEKLVNDGQWHKVEASRNGKNGELIIDDCPESQPAGLCRASGGVGTETTLDVNDVPLSIGGTSTIDALLARPWQVSSADFLGCLRNVDVNGERLDLSAPLAQRGTVEGCDRDTETCNGNQCGDGGTCVDEWWSYWCQCNEGLTGTDCGKVPMPFTFGAGSYVEYVVKETYQRQQLLDAAKATARRRRRRRDTTSGSQTISLAFRTGTADGLLLVVESGDDFTTVMMTDGAVRYKFGSASQSRGTVGLTTNVADWDWHVLTLYREGATITLEVDSETESQRFGETPHDFTGMDVSGMSLGGTRTPLLVDGRNISAFVGCLEDFQLNNQALPLEGATEMFDAVPSENTGTDGCVPVLLGPCDTNPCLTNQLCIVDGPNYTCECKEGTLENGCKGATSGNGNTLLITLVSVFAVVLIVVVLGCFVLMMWYRNKARRAKADSTGRAKNAFSMDSLDNPGFSADTFDNPTMIGSQHGKMSNGIDGGGIIRQHPDIIEQNSHTPVDFIVDNDDIVIGEEASGRDLDVAEHYDLENASSIAPSDIEPAYHYRYYHDGRERKHRRHGYGHSPNPLLSRIGTPPCESPVSQMSSTGHTPHHLDVTRTPNQKQLHVRGTSPGVIPAVDRASPAVVMIRQSPALHQQETAMRSATPLRISRSNTPVRNISSPGSDQSYNQSELRSQGHHSDVSSQHSLKGNRTRISPSQKVLHNRPSRPPSRLKETSPGDPSRPLGLTVEEVKRLNTARPDLMTGSHTSTVDNLSSVGSSKRPNPLGNLPPLPSDLEPSPLLEPPDSSSSDETAGSFTCSEADSEHEKLTSRKMDPGMLLLSRLSQDEMDDGETYEQFSAPFKRSEGLDSKGGSLSTLFASEDENVDPSQKVNGQFSWDQFLNWGPRFETLVGVFADISQLQETTPAAEKTVYVEQTAEEFV